MRIAGIQITAGPDIGKNVSRAVEMAEVAVEKGARIICYPELFLSPWFPKEEEKTHLSLALEASNEALSPFKRLSKKTKTVLVIPLFESSNGKYYNSAAVIDGGKLLGIYRKVHLPDIPLYRERFYFSPGDAGFPVFETSQGKIGVQICWDNLFPEGSRILALKGAEVVFAPNAASQNTHHLWEKAICATAFANNIYVFRVNRVGQEDGVSFYGRSFCAGPWGEMASELAGSKEAVILADADPREREAARETWGFLRRRRPGEYGELVK
jgi:N-carbamoylputrescine amidase